jgi:hypothetical protein
VTTIATADKLRELDEDERRAWKEYQDQIQGLTGDSYEQIEAESWEALQEELRELERQRRHLSAAGA